MQSDHSAGAHPYEDMTVLVEGITIDDIRKAREREQAAERVTARFSPIPASFTGLASWPEYTNLRCWHCTLIPKGRPLFMPPDIYFNEKGEPCCDRPEGNFNTWKCVIAHIYKHVPRDDRWDTIERVKIFMNVFRGAEKNAEIPLSELMPAPRKEIMEQYGGDKTEEEYLKMIEGGESDMELYAKAHKKV
jgi:hypothetical protein